MGSDQHFQTDLADITARRGNVDLTPFYAEGNVPRSGGGLGSRTLAKQGGRFPVTSGSSGPPKAGDDHNSDKLGPQPKEAIGSEKLSPVAHRREQDLFKTSPPALQSPHRSLTRSR